MDAAPVSELRDVHPLRMMPRGLGARQRSVPDLGQYDPVATVRRAIGLALGAEDQRCCETFLARVSAGLDGGATLGMAVLRAADAFRYTPQERLAGWALYRYDRFPPPPGVLLWRSSARRWLADIAERYRNQDDDGRVRALLTARR